MTTIEGGSEGVPPGPDYEGVADRVARIIAWLGILGTGAAILVKGWSWGGGFFFGSLIAALNFRWLRGLVDSLGGGGRRRSGSVFLAFRYLLLGGAAYVIVRFTSVRLAAVFAGVFVLTAALMIEAVIEIVYARK